MITHSFVRGYRIMVITLAFQANDVSSILTIRSRILVLTSPRPIAILNRIRKCNKVKTKLNKYAKGRLRSGHPLKS